MTSTPVDVERAPVIVEREVYVAQPREIVVYGPAIASAPVYDPRFPQTGPWIDHGLFNRKGPNDFGS